MAFFKLEHILLANHNRQALQEYYRHTEEELRKAVKTGDERKMQKAMENHQSVEYALLYQESPEYLKKKKIVYTGKGKTIEENNKRKQCYDSRNAKKYFLIKDKF